MAASRHLRFGAAGSRSIRSAVPENPTLGSNRKSIGRPVPEIWPFEIMQYVFIHPRKEELRDIIRSLGTVYKQLYYLFIHPGNEELQIFIRFNRYVTEIKQL